MHVHNLHYRSSNDAMSDPNVTSLFLTLTEPTTVKANYRLQISQKALPDTTANKLQHHYAWRWPRITEICAYPSWAVGPSIHRGEEIQCGIAACWKPL